MRILMISANVSYVLAIRWLQALGGGRRKGRQTNKFDAVCC
jgi:hypothetical protein